ncbi:hypothetical protein D3C85_1213450 [compost metagenome]
MQNCSGVELRRSQAASGLDPALERVAVKQHRGTGARRGTERQRHQPTQGGEVAGREVGHVAEPDLALRNLDRRAQLDGHLCRMGAGHEGDRDDRRCRAPGVPICAGH